MKTCSVCGRDFDASHGWQKYCSADCRRQVQLQQQRDWYYEHQSNPLPEIICCALCGVEFEPRNTHHRYCGKCSETVQREHKRKFTRHYRAEGREDRSNWIPESKEDRRERWQRYYAKHGRELLDRIRGKRYANGQYPGKRSDTYWENRNYLIYELELPCIVCGTREDLHAHHIVAVEDGGSDDVENLVILCEAHHTGSGMGIHSLGAEEFVARYGIQFGMNQD